MGNKGVHAVNCMKTVLTSSVLHPHLQKALQQTSISPSHGKAQRQCTYTAHWDVTKPNCLYLHVGLDHLEGFEKLVSLLHSVKPLLVF